MKETYAIYIINTERNITAPFVPFFYILQEIVRNRYILSCHPVIPGGRFTLIVKFQSVIITQLKYIHVYCFTCQIM